VLQGCSPNQHKLNILFVDKYGSESFDKFKGKHFMIRSYGRKDIIVGIWDDSIPCGFVCMRISKDNKELLKSSFIPQRDSCTFSYDQDEYYNLVKDFLAFNIHSLTVDNYNNVYVKTIYTERRACLIQVNDCNNIKTHDGDQFTKFKDNWYERNTNTQHTVFR